MDNRGSPHAPLRPTLREEQLEHLWRCFDTDAAGRAKDEGQAWAQAGDVLLDGECLTGLMVVETWASKSSEDGQWSPLVN